MVLPISQNKPYGHFNYKWILGTLPSRKCTTTNLCKNSTWQKSKIKSLKNVQGIRNMELNVCGIHVSYNVPTTCNTQHKNTHRLSYLLSNYDNMVSQRLGTGRTLSSRFVRQKITLHIHDLKQFRRISESKHPSDHKSNTLNMV